jgi:hypothetical protein
MTFIFVANRVALSKRLQQVFIVQADDLGCAADKVGAHLFAGMDAGAVPEKRLLREYVLDRFGVLEVASSGGINIALL